MKYFLIEMTLFISLFCCNFSGIKAKSIKVRTVNLQQNIVSPQYNYPRVRKPMSTIQPSSSAFDISQRRNEVFQQTDPVILPGATSENSEDVIQTTFNRGIRNVFEYLRNLILSYIDVENGILNRNGGNMLKIPGLPTTSIFHHLNVSSVVKLLEATDGSQVEMLAEAAVVDIVYQLIHIIGFNDLREWLGIIVMSFVLGPIMIPLYWLPISLFGMAGLLIPLFLFNPPSKLNVDVMGHDPIVPEREVNNEQRSLENLLFNMVKNSTISNQSAVAEWSTGLVESCMERMSCHFTRFYRNNPVSQWLTSHFNTTKVEWARLLPEDDVNGNGMSSWDDCRKYKCSVFPAA